MLIDDEKGKHGLVSWIVVNQHFCLWYHFLNGLSCNKLGSSFPFENKRLTMNALF